MDLFNRKKLAALQSELALTTAQLNATTKELAALQDDIVKSYQELTDYFRPKYAKKYFKANCPEVALDGKDYIVFRCEDLEYNGGVIKMIITEPNNPEEQSGLELEIHELKKLSIITKKEYNSEIPIE